MPSIVAATTPGLPMRGLNSWAVRSGSVMAESFATWPTSQSFVSRPMTKCTTEGVVESPLRFLPMTGLPSSSMAAMQEYVVPRSMPTMVFFWSLMRFLRCSP